MRQEGSLFGHRQGASLQDQWTMYVFNADKLVYATSHLCPHYKAPLAKGVLSIDGDKARIECQWHGACFDAKTGDIEDGPSLDGLMRYDVSFLSNDRSSSRETRCTCSQTIKVSRLQFAQQRHQTQQTSPCLSKIFDSSRTNYRHLGGWSRGSLGCRNVARGTIFMRG